MSKLKYLSKRKPLEMILRLKLKLLMHIHTFMVKQINVFLNS